MSEEIKVNDTVKELNKTAAQMLIECQRSEIKTNEQYVNAAEMLKEIKAKIKELETERKSMTEPLDATKKKIMDFFRKPVSWLEESECFVKKAMLKFQQDQERIRREQEKKLQDEAREREAKEKARLEARAQKAEEKGKDDKAEALREQAEQVSVPAPVLASTVEKVEGIKTMKVWKFRITDEKLIPREYLSVNEKAIGQVVRATKGVVQIPGVEVYPEDTIAAGIR